MPGLRLRNRFKQKIQKGVPAFVIYVTVPYSGIIGSCGALGYDAVIIDMEHTSFNLSTVEEMIAASEAADMTPLVRIPEINNSLIARVLDAGAQGIVVPHVTSAADVSSAVRAAKFPPEGTRSWGGAHTRANKFIGRVYTFGTGVYSKSYVKSVNRSIVVIPIIENEVACQNIAEITSLDGIETVAFGAGDLSVGLGFDAKKVDEYLDYIYSACKARHVGLQFMYSERMAKLFYPGCSYALGVDALMLTSVMASVLSQARARLGPGKARQGKQARKNAHSMFVQG